MLEHAEHCRAEIARLENAGEIAEALEARIEEAEGERARLAEALDRGPARRRATSWRAGSPRSSPSWRWTARASRSRSSPIPSGFGAGGAETVEFLVATNPGMPASPLKEAASGGELSRIMLALTGLASGDGRRTLVFDEIDAGVGGNTARAVGERLRRLGETRQVLCITHLPQVASLAATHFRIEKHAAGGEARATVERVAGDELVAEIVRMLGGERGDTVASRHAEELLKAA